MQELEAELPEASPRLWKGLLQLGREYREQNVDRIVDLVCRRWPSASPRDLGRFLFPSPAFAWDAHPEAILKLAQAQTSEGVAGANLDRLAEVLNSLSEPCRDRYAEAIVEMARTQTFGPSVAKILNSLSQPCRDRYAEAIVAIRSST